ncbi:hypothetical protein AB6E88_00675 [Providencia hangzhouensis]
MEQPYTVTLAETALWSLQDVESFKINFMSSVQAAAFVDHYYHPLEQYQKIQSVIAQIKC